MFKNLSVVCLLAFGVIGRSNAGIMDVNAGKERSTKSSALGLNSDLHTRRRLMSFGDDWKKSNKWGTTAAPSKNPTPSPTPKPTKPPTKKPTPSPTKPPTKKPTPSPTKAPTKPPTKKPTPSPTKAPTKPPTKKPTRSPTRSPTTPAPTKPNLPPISCKCDASYEMDIYYLVDEGCGHLDAEQCEDYMRGVAGLVSIPVDADAKNDCHGNRIGYIGIAAGKEDGANELVISMGDKEYNDRSEKMDREKLHDFIFSRGEDGKCVRDKKFNSGKEGLAEAVEMAFFDWEKYKVATSATIYPRYLKFVIIQSCFEEDFEEVCKRFEDTKKYDHLCPGFDGFPEITVVNVNADGGSVEQNNLQCLDKDLHPLFFTDDDNDGNADNKDFGNKFMDKVCNKPEKCPTPSPTKYPTKSPTKSPTKYPTTKTPTGWAKH